MASLTPMQRFGVRLQATLKLQLATGFAFFVGVYTLYVHLQLDKIRGLLQK